MVLTNRSWPGTSTIPARVPSGRLEEREAQLDGDAALFLLLQAVRVRPGEGLHQRGLAVVDVAGGADDEMAHGSTIPCRHAEHKAGGRTRNG